MVYSSSSRALACLETVVHLNAGGLPLNRYLVEIAIPDDLIKTAETANKRTVGVGWDALPEGRVSIEFGSKWVKEQRSAVLLVPSIIVEEEQNALINPKHPDTSKIQFRKIRKWLYDPRLLAVKK